jgi:hypothetical protein
MKLLSLVIASALGAAASGAGLKTNIESASQLCNLLLQLQQKAKGCHALFQNRGFSASREPCITARFRGEPVSRSGLEGPAIPAFFLRALTCQKGKGLPQSRTLSPHATPIAVHGRGTNPGAPVYG